MNYFMFGNDDLMGMIGMFVYYWDFIIEKNNYTNPINPGFYNNKQKKMWACSQSIRFRIL